MKQIHYPQARLSVGFFFRDDKPVGILREVKGEIIPWLSNRAKFLTRSVNPGEPGIRLRQIDKKSIS